LKDVKDPVTLEIIGTIEDKEYYELCRNKMMLLPTNIKVKSKEDMPFEKAIERLYKNHFLVSPTHGENFGHAIFDALSVGRPVIISDQTPWRDLQDKGIGWDIPLQDKLKFKTAIQKAVSMDQDEFDEYCKRAKKFSDDYIRDSNLREKYMELFVPEKTASNT
jgi:glycosyltransferase involved in cell wall biosynthesis